MPVVKGVLVVGVELSDVNDHHLVIKLNRLLKGMGPLSLFIIGLLPFLLIVKLIIFKLRIMYYPFDKF